MRMPRHGTRLLVHRAGPRTPHGRRWAVFEQFGRRFRMPRPFGAAGERGPAVPRCRWARGRRKPRVLGARDLRHHVCRRAEAQMLFSNALSAWAKRSSGSRSGRAEQRRRLGIAIALGISARIGACWRRRTRRSPPSSAAAASGPLRTGSCGGAGRTRIAHRSSSQGTPPGTGGETLAAETTWPTISCPGVHGQRHCGALRRWGGCAGQCNAACALTLIQHAAGSRGSRSSASATCQRATRSHGRAGWSSSARMSVRRPLEIRRSGR